MNIKVSSHADLDLQRRLPKAEKVRRLVGLEAPLRRPFRILEVGAGAGAISYYFSQLDPVNISINAVDVADQRQVFDGYQFQTYDGVSLPFSDHSFDLVISNHVVEHILGWRQQKSHVFELARVLAERGTLYLATPSRWQIVEPHFRLPFLSWLPRPWRSMYVRWSGRGAHYDCDPLTHAGIEKLFAAAQLQYRNQNVAALRMASKVEGSSGAWIRFLNVIPDRVLAWFYRLSPTMVYILNRAPDY